MNVGSGSSHVVVLTTLENPDQAVQLVRHLVDRRVVACGTIFERVTSVYRWKGTVEKATETQVMLKTQRALWGDLQAAVRELHPYEVPELLALPVTDGLSSYLDWVTAETTVEGKREA